MWRRALKDTEIIRARVKSLSMMGDTRVPYVLLSESSINLGDTVVRKGEVLVQKPALFIPPNNPQFQGFEFERGEDRFDETSFINFLIVRGIAALKKYKKVFICLTAYYCIFLIACSINTLLNYLALYAQ